MQQCRFTQRKLFDHICQRRRRLRPVFSQLNQRCFDLWRIERFSCLRSNPGFAPLHLMEHDADWSARPVIAARGLRSVSDFTHRNPKLK
jgi:hypothetical protein